MSNTVVIVAFAFGLSCWNLPLEVQRVSAGPSERRTCCNSTGARLSVYSKPAAGQHQHKQSDGHLGLERVQVRTSEPCRGWQATAKKLLRIGKQRQNPKAITEKVAEIGSLFPVARVVSVGSQPLAADECPPEHCTRHPQSQNDRSCKTTYVSLHKALRRAQALVQNSTLLRIMNSRVQLGRICKPKQFI